MRDRYLLIIHRMASRIDRMLSVYFRYCIRSVSVRGERRGSVVPDERGRQQHRQGQKHKKRFFPSSSSRTHRRTKLEAGNTKGGYH